MGQDAGAPDQRRRDPGVRRLLQAEPEWDFLRLLRDEGRRAAGAFLAAHSGSLGRRSTLDLDALLAGV